MAWTRLFRRRDRAASDAAPAGPGEPGGDVQRAPAPAERPAAPPAWTQLAPLRPAASRPIEPVARTRAFVHDLDGHQPVYRALEPLAHDVHLDAPGGLVSGIAAPRTAPPPATPLSFAVPPAPPAEPPPAPASRTTAGTAQRAPLPRPTAVTRPAATAPTAPRPVPAMPAMPVRRRMAAASGDAPAASPGQTTSAAAPGGAPTPQRAPLTGSPGPRPVPPPPEAPAAPRPAGTAPAALAPDPAVAPAAGPVPDSHPLPLPPAPGAPAAVDAPSPAPEPRSRLGPQRSPEPTATAPRTPPVEPSRSTPRRRPVLGPPLVGRSDAPPPPGRPSPPTTAPVGPAAAATPAVPASPGGPGHAEPLPLGPSVQRAPDEASPVPGLPSVPERPVVQPPAASAAHGTHPEPVTGPAPTAATASPGAPAGERTASLPLAPARPSPPEAERPSVQRAPARPRGVRDEPAAPVSAAHREPPPIVPLRPVSPSPVVTPDRVPLVARRGPVPRTPDTPVPRAPSPGEPGGGPAPAAPVQRAPLAPPAEVRSMVESRTGADLSDVAVHRGPAVADAARDLQARAFTVDGAVHLPDEHGPLSAGAGRSLLAHELTHVAQQRVLGPGLPPESSPLGQRLEAEAVAAERTASTGATVRPPAGTQSAPLPLAQRAPEPGTPTPDPAVAALRAGVARPAGDGTIHFAPPGAPAGSIPHPGAATGGVQRAPAAEGQAAPSAATSGAAAGEGDGGDVDDAQELDELARRLWPRLSERLRGDLLTQREHGGALVERF